MNTYTYMDKQIMELSDTINKQDILPSYDFHPMRSVTTSSPRADTSPIRNHGSLDSIDTAKVILGKDRNSVDGALVYEIDKTMKKYADNILLVLEGLNDRLFQMEGRTHQIENSMDDLKIAIGNNYGSSDGKMRHLENLLREVQTDVHLIKDKQEIMEAQFQLAKLQVSNVEQQPEIHNPVNTDNMQHATACTPQQLPPGTPSTASPSLPPSNSAPPPARQNLPQHVQAPNQFASSQVPPISLRDSYFPQHGQIPENASQQYQLPPPLQLHPGPHQQGAPLTQYHVPTQPQYSQPPPPPSQQPNPSQSALKIPPQSPRGHHPDETPYMQSQSYQMDSHQPPSHFSLSSARAPQIILEPQPMRLGPGIPGGYASLSASGDPYSYSSSPSKYGSGSPVKAPPGISGGYASLSASGDPYSYSSSPSKYGSGSPVKAPQFPATGMGYSQLPTARLLPQALPTASSVGGGSGSSNTGNRVPVDDVIDKVTTMGFSREQVRETVRRLTENGQSVDLNIVLDKLMKGGDGQQSRGWFGR